MAQQTGRRALPVVAHPCEVAVADGALARAFLLLGKRWNALVVANLRHGPLGFRDLSRAVRGISDSVLSDRLLDLAAAGLVARHVEPGPPLAVAYDLTDRGRALLPALKEISLWAQAHLPENAVACSARPE